MTVDDQAPESQRPAPALLEKPAAPAADRTSARASGLSSSLPSSLPKKKGGLAVASALLVSLLVTARLVSWPTEGTLTAAERTTLALDDRIGLVVEKGATLAWRRSWRGHLTLDLEHGRAFVRLSSGSLHLTTPTIGLRTSMGAFSVEATPDDTVLVVHEGQASVTPRAESASTTEPQVIEAGSLVRAPKDRPVTMSDTSLRL